jgi:8-oxo-dGTP pyrophosphatase MutT (NUDIX family)
MGVVQSRQTRILSLKAVLTDGAGRCLLLRRSPANRYNVGKWDFPGGKALAGESVSQALSREVREETGLDIIGGEVLGAAHSERDGVPVAYLVVRVTSRTLDVRLSEEHDQHCWVRFEDLPRMDLAPQFLDLARRIASSPRPAPIASLPGRGSARRERAAAGARGQPSRVTHQRRT